MADFLSTAICLVVCNRPLQNIPAAFASGTFRSVSRGLMQGVFEGECESYGVAQFKYLFSIAKSAF